MKERDFTNKLVECIDGELTYVFQCLEVVGKTVVPIPGSVRFMGTSGFWLYGNREEFPIHKCTFVTLQNYDTYKKLKTV